MTATRLLASDSGLKYAGKSAYGSYSFVTYVVSYGDGCAGPFDVTKNGMDTPGNRAKMPPSGTFGDAIITNRSSSAGGAPGWLVSSPRRTCSATIAPSE